MTRQIRKAAVLGAGVMGAAIAAHLANVGIPVLLLDIVPNEPTPDEAAKGLTLDSPAVRNRFATRGLETAKKAKPAAFYAAEDAQLVQIGNIEDDLQQLAACDWIIEAVVENLAIKQQLFAKVESVVHEEAIVSSNTSGISITDMAQGRSPAFRKRFLGTHFFNPPRYMKLLEIIPGPDTDEEILAFMRDFGARVLGKGVVFAKDTPNFIANRIGTYGLLVTLDIMKKHGLGVDEVDAITGPAMGRPKSATFRTLDLVGLDTFVHVAKNVQASVTEASEKEAFAVPAYIEQMVANRWLGDKTGHGFFKKERTAAGKEIQALDLDTLEYRPRKKLDSKSLKSAKNAPTVAKKLQTLVYGEDVAAQFAWDVLKKALLYTAEKHGEIADDIVAVDNAMKWGFNWKLGPYETWDAIGVRKSVERMRAEGETIPQLVEELLASGRESFYEREKGEVPKFYVAKNEFRTVEEPKQKIDLARLKEAGKVIFRNTEASLIDIGDGVVCLEYHSLKQAVTPGVIEMTYKAADEVAANWEGLVIGNQDEYFCVGANILLMLMEAQQKHWDNLNDAVNQFQQAMMRIKYLNKPVVAAPFNMTLGGGAEVCFPADRIQAAGETYMGLVEVGLGLIPGGGGNKEVLIRAVENVPGDIDERLDLFVRKAFENIGTAKVSTSAKEAKKMGLLRAVDGISVNADYQLYDAKQVVLGLARAGYQAPQPKLIPVIGENGAAVLKVGVYQMKMSGYISDHDELVARHLINVLTGGAVPRGTMVTEQYLLDLEREAFLSLIGEQKTQERMQYMLTAGKPLRN